jgi:hypothetical protein
MKREYVLEKIESLITWQRQDLNNGSDLEDADTILRLLENLGMLPPNVCNVNGTWDDLKHAAHFHTHKDMNYWEDT